MFPVNADGDAPQLFAPGHYYSAIPALSDVRAAADRLWRKPPPRHIPGIHLNALGQVGLLRELARYYPEMPFTDDATAKGGMRYHFRNDFFGPGDAFYLYSMLRYLRPRRLIEVGSGYSSAVTLDTNDRFLDHSLTCAFIEPHPERLDTLLSTHDRGHVDILPRPVQEVPVDYFDILGAGDVLFIDGSHVSKTSSDVNYVFFDVLPRLRSGVYIHIHDIFYPFEYPRTWVEEGRGWNEAYLVRALLQASHGLEIALWAHYLALFQHDMLAECAPRVLENTGGSLWLRRL